MGRKKTRLLLLLLAVALVGWCTWMFRREALAYYHAWCCWYGFGEADYHRDRLIALKESAWPALRWWLHRYRSEDMHTAIALLAHWLNTMAETGRPSEVLRRIADDWPGLTESTQAAVLHALYICATFSQTLEQATTYAQDGVPSRGEDQHVADYEQAIRNDSSVCARPISADLAWATSSKMAPGVVCRFLLQVQPLANRSARLVALRLSRWASLAQEDSAEAGLASYPESETQLSAGSGFRSDWWHWCRQLAEVALSDDREEIRSEAVRLAALPQIKLKEKLARRLLGQPGEPAASVRALLLIAVGDRDSEEFAPTESLTRWLHDESFDVRGICEQVLRTRGLTPQQIQLARMWTDPDPLVRMHVPCLVYQESGIDPVPWLERLSRDTSAAVRAAVIRAAYERKELRFAARLAEMAQEDSSVTIRQLASFYQRELFAQR